MKQYIDKAAVVAEIERIKKEECPTDSYEGRCKLLWFEQFLSFLDTLETNTFEVKEVDEEYNGKAMLHVLEKGVKQGRRELIENACKWWEEELSYPSMTQEEIKWYKSKVNKFRKAMEE